MVILNKPRFDFSKHGFKRVSTTLRCSAPLLADGLFNSKAIYAAVYETKLIAAPSAVLSESSPAGT